MPLCDDGDYLCWPNSCNVNVYPHADVAIGAHSDDEALFGGGSHQTRIISLSLGGPRTFELCTQDSLSPKGSVTLRHGDLLCMSGMTQKFYRHRVLKGKSGSAGMPADDDPPSAFCPSDDSGWRVNLTWRWIEHHQTGSPDLGNAIAVSKNKRKKNRGKKGR